MKKEGLKVAGYYGSWYVIDEGFFNSSPCYLLEHEKYGDEAPCLIVDSKLHVIAEDVYNGFSDLPDEIPMRLCASGGNGKTIFLL